MTLLYANPNVQVEPRADHQPQHSPSPSSSPSSSAEPQPQHFTRILEIDENRLVQFSFKLGLGDNAAPMYLSHKPSSSNPDGAHVYPFLTPKNPVADDGETAVPFDAMVRVKMSSMRFLFVQRFWQDIKAYFNWFEGMNHVVNTQAARVAQAATKKRYHHDDDTASCNAPPRLTSNPFDLLINRVGFEIVLLHPMLIYPKDAKSPECIVAGTCC